MEAEQYTSEPTSKLLHCIAVSEYPQSAWHTHRRDNRAVKAAPLKANAQFIRPFDLGVHTFKEKPLLVNWPVEAAKAYKKLRSGLHQRTSPLQRTGGHLLRYTITWQSLKTEV